MERLPPVPQYPLLQAETLLSWSAIQPRDKIRFMPSSYDAPPVTLDRALEVGPDDWQGPGFYQLMTALVVPRPVGWISTISAAGVPTWRPIRTSI